MVQNNLKSLETKPKIENEKRSKVKKKKKKNNQ